MYTPNFAFPSFTDMGKFLEYFVQKFQLSFICIDLPLEMVRIVTRHSHVHSVIRSCYRPPDSQPEFVNIFDNAIEQVTNKFPNVILLLAGDFDYPSIAWLASSVLGNSNRQKLIHSLHMVHVHNLSHLEKEPTGGQNILDRIFISYPEYESAFVLKEISDPKALNCILEVPERRKTKEPKKIIAYARADITKTKQVFAEFADFSMRSGKHNWSLFTDFLKELEDCYMPKLTLAFKAGDPWLTHDMNRAISKKAGI